MNKSYDAAPPAAHQLLAHRFAALPPCRASQIKDVHSMTDAVLQQAVAQRHSALRELSVLHCEVRGRGGGSSSVLHCEVCGRGGGSVGRKRRRVRVKEAAAGTGARGDRGRNAGGADARGVGGVVCQYACLHQGASAAVTADAGARFA